MQLLKDYLLVSKLIIRLLSVANRDKSFVMLRVTINEKKSVKLCLVHDFKSTKLALFMIHIRIVGLFPNVNTEGSVLFTSF